MDATSATWDEEPPIEKIEANILTVQPIQESQKGSEYTLLSISSPETLLQTRVFVWDAAWRQEIEQHRGGYYYLDVELYVRDHRGLGADEPWYWLEAVMPQNERLAERFLERWKLQFSGRL